MGSVRVNTNRGLTNEMLRSYGVPYLDDVRKTPWVLELGVDEEQGAAAVRQWRRERSGLPTAACLRESDP
jgi:hypothetical protein